MLSAIRFHNFDRPSDTVTMSGHVWSGDRKDIIQVHDSVYGGKCDDWYMFYAAAFILAALSG